MERLSLGAGDRYCEIGCGGGVLLHMAMQRVARGSAIDHSSEMVIFSQGKNRECINQRTARYSTATGPMAERIPPWIPEILLVTARGKRMLT